MTDFRSLEELDVYRGNEPVATLRRLPKGCEFRYTDAFLESNQPAIALHLPKTSDGIKVEGIANLPTYFAGLLPEGVMLTAARALIGAAAGDLFAVLAATGADAIGDIDVRIPGESERQPITNLAEAPELIKSLLEKSGQFPAERLAAISGVQPKLSLGEIVRASRRSRYIAKFESPDFPGLLQNESACMTLGRRCGLQVATTKLEPNALIVTRFDRVFNPLTDRIEKLHVEDLLQVMDLFPNSKYSLEFDALMVAMERLAVSKATLLDAMRLYVFSYLIGNGDLHAKNLSLIFDAEDRQWRLSPAYDLLSTLPYAERLPGADRMALALADESYGNFTVEEFVEFGLRFGLPAVAVVGMVKRVSRIVRKATYLLSPALPKDIRQKIVERADSLSG